MATHNATQTTAAKQPNRGFLAGVSSGANAFRGLSTLHSPLPPRHAVGDTLIGIEEMGPIGGYGAFIFQSRTHEEGRWFAPYNL